MDNETYISAAAEKLKRSDYHWWEDGTDAEAVIDVLNKCYDDDFTLEDAVRYTRCTEHVSPEIGEQTACSRMAVIAAKYPARVSKFCR